MKFLVVLILEVCVRPGMASFATVSLKSEILKLISILVTYLGSSGLMCGLLF